MPRPPLFSLEITSHAGAPLSLHPPSLPIPALSASSHPRPLASPPDEQFYANHAGPTYNWRSFSRRDKLAKAAFNSAARAPQLGGVLDTAPMNLRADAHISSHGALGRPKKPGSIDCLHLCHTADGGPLALGPQLLLHALETRQVFF